MLKVRTDVLGSAYLLKSNFNADGYRLVFTQLVNNSLQNCSGWAQTCSLEDFPIYLQTYNPLIEAESNAMLKKLEKSIWDEKTDLQVTGGVTSEERTVQISAPLSDESPNLKLIWKFECSALPSHEYCAEFLQPLLSTSLLLSYENQLLVSIIERKDKEIAEHRSNGSIIKRAHLETRPFEVLNFQSEVLKSQTVVDMLTEPGPRLNQYGLSSQLSQVSQLLHQQSAGNSQSSEQTAEGMKRNEEQVSPSSSNKLSTSSKASSPIKQPQEVKSCKSEKEVEEERRAEIKRLQNQRAPQPAPAPRKRKILF